MGNKIIIALFLNLLFLLLSGYIFITKGIGGDFILWKITASLLGVIGFSFFVIMILKQLKKL